MATQETQKLIKHLDEAVAMERSVLRMLESMVRTTGDETLQRMFEEHQRVTREHIERLEERLRAHGRSPSFARSAGGALAGQAKAVVDVVRRDKPGRNARDAFATENLEIASYELLERVAAKAGDNRTVDVAKKNKAEDRAMASRIGEDWERYAELSVGDGSQTASAGIGRGVGQKLSSAVKNPIVLGAGSVAAGVLLGRRGQKRSGSRTQSRAEATTSEATKAELEGLPKGELQRRAEDAGIEVRKSMTKQQLVDALGQRLRRSARQTTRSR